MINGLQVPSTGFFQHFNGTYFYASLSVACPLVLTPMYNQVHKLISLHSSLTTAA